CIFFFQAEDGIRDFHVTGVQTCALPILIGSEDEYCENCGHRLGEDPPEPEPGPEHEPAERDRIETALGPIAGVTDRGLRHERNEIGRASCRERGEMPAGARAPTQIDKSM